MSAIIQPYTGTKVQEAEAMIGRLLAQLETDTGGLVERIEIFSIETTCHTDKRPQLQQRVSITLRRTPGTRWE